MYDRALEYNRFNFDAWDGKIKLLEKQGSFVAAQTVRLQKQQAMDDQKGLIADAFLLPLPGHIVIIALFGAMLLVVMNRKKNNG
jgi:uncharacterized membrane protein (DUF106 family)